ncbi:hypothetical protein H6783_02810 [Candidatus Nomurabacteria bacterium]|nr:hypothetical protein [Candidatus Nomurabacteria bacterium]
MNRPCVRISNNMHAGTFLFLYNPMSLEDTSGAFENMPSDLKETAKAVAELIAEREPSEFTPTISVEGHQIFVSAKFLSTEVPTLTFIVESTCTKDIRVVYDADDKKFVIERIQ